MKKKAIIKDNLELKKVVDYCLSHDLSLATIEEYYTLTEKHKKYLFERSMGYSLQQEELVEQYNKLNVSPAYLEYSPSIKEKKPLSVSEQKELFKKIDEIDKEHVGKRLVYTNKELSRVLKKLSSLGNKYGKEIHLCDLYKRKNPNESLKDILARDGFDEERIKLICEEYENFIELKKKKKQLTKERDELLKKKRDLINNNPEYSRIFETLVITNVYLVDDVLRRAFMSVPLPKEEAYGYALEGLNNAINYFDYTKSNNFALYAYKNIFSNIEKNFKNMIGINWKDYYKKKDIAYWRRKLAIDDGQILTPEELANSGFVEYTKKQIADLDKSIDIIYNDSDFYDLLDDSCDKSRYIMPMNQEDYDFVDAMEDEMGIPNDQDEVEREIYLPFLKETIREVVGELTEREQKVLSLRFGLEDGIDRTLEEVGKELNVKRERARQIEAKALRKMRSISRRERLLPFTEDFVMPKRREPLANKEEYVAAFMRLYELRDKNLSYRAKAFFISNGDLVWDEKEAKNLDVLLEAFITNLSLGDDCYPLDKIIDEFCYNLGDSYFHKYPYRKIYNELKNKLSDEEKRIIDEKTKKDILEDPYNIVKLALKFEC